MGGKKLGFGFFQVRLEQGRGNPLLIPSHGKNQIMVSPEGLRRDEITGFGIVEIDPADGKFFASLGHGTKGMFGQTGRGPLIKIIRK